MVDTAIAMGTALVHSRLMATLCPVYRSTACCTSPDSPLHQHRTDTQPHADRTVHLVTAAGGSKSRQWAQQRRLLRDTVMAGCSRRVSAQRAGNCRHTLLCAAVQGPTMDQAPCAAMSTPHIPGQVPEHAEAAVEDGFRGRRAV